MSALAVDAQDACPRVEKIRVMLVDDSAVVRGLFNRWLSEEAAIEVVARCHTGAQAVNTISNVNPDLVILDIEMPEMDGLQALPHLLTACPTARILIASSLSTRNADVSLQALSKGAHDCIAKPSTNSCLSTSKEFRTDLIDRIYALCGRARRTALREKRALHIQNSAKETVRDPSKTNHSVAKAAPAHFTSSLHAGGSLVEFVSGRPDIVCIGSSTGGPRAVHKVLSDAQSGLKDVPIVLTQHMPKSFTTVFAGHLDKAIDLDVKEAKHGDVLKPGQVLVAPGDHHMLFKRQGGVVEVVLDDGPAVNFCKPAVDKMFASASELYRNKVLSVILTGMGQDGSDGGRVVVENGGNVIIQDAKSSVVWGMPGSAFRAGVAAAQFPLDTIGSKIAGIVREGKL